MAFEAGAALDWCFLGAAAITKRLFAPIVAARQTVGVFSRVDHDAMNAPSRARPLRARRYLAGLMALVVLVASLVVAAHEPVRAMPHDGWAVATLSTFHKDLPQPCRRIIPPGAFNLCPLSGSSFGFVARFGADYPVPTAFAATQWRLSHSSLAAQCCGYSPYRPPRFTT